MQSQVPCSGGISSSENLLDTCLIAPEDYAPMPTPEELQQVIINKLLAADASACEHLTDKIKLLWTLAQWRSGASAELQYLLTEQEAIKVLMMCAAKQVDISRRDESGKYLATQEATREGNAQGQGTSQSTRTSDFIASSRYDDTSASRSDSGSQHTSVSSFYSDGTQSSSLFERGSSKYRMDYDEEHRFADETKGEETAFENDTGARARTGCTYTYDRFTVDGFGFPGYSHSQKITKGWYQHNLQDASYNVDTSGSDAFSQQYGQGDQTRRRTTTSHSYTYSISTSHTAGSSGSMLDSRSTTFSDANSHAGGQGQGQSSRAARDEGSSQSTASSEDVAHSSRDADGSTVKTADSLKLHQKFLHLKAMYDASLTMFKLVMMQLNSSNFKGGELCVRVPGSIRYWFNVTKIVEVPCGSTCTNSGWYDNLGDNITGPSGIFTAV